MFHGSITALVTPMHANGEIDFDNLRKLVDWQIANKTDAIVVNGTTGESAGLTTDEQLAMIQAVVEYVEKRVPVIAGTGDCSTQKTISLTRRAMELGVNACLLITPAYSKPTQEGLFQHYRAIAAAVPIPQILYNAPTRTGCDLLPETVIRLAAISNIVGIKEDSPERVRVIIQHCGKGLDVFSGYDGATVEIIRLGGKGVISVAANIVPRAMHDLCAAALANNFAVAENIDQRLMPLYKQLFIETNPIPAKWALHQLGHIQAGIRLPLTPLSESCHADLHTAVQQANAE